MSIGIVRSIFLFLQVYYTLERPGSKKTLVSKHSRRNLVDKNMLAGMKYSAVQPMYLMVISTNNYSIYNVNNNLWYRSKVIQLRLETRAQGAWQIWISWCDKSRGDCLLFVSWRKVSNKTFAFVLRYYTYKIATKAFELNELSFWFV